MLFPLFGENRIFDYKHSLSENKLFTNRVNYSDRPCGLYEIKDVHLLTYQITPTDSPYL